MSIHKPLYLMKGYTAHHRSVPKSHSFRYGVTMIDVDVDRLAEADLQSRVFSVDKANLVSLDTSSRGDLGKTRPGVWARQLFSKAGIETTGCTIRLLTFPKTELFSFAPISVWSLLDETDDLKGLIYEVNNTFGERHCYVTKINDGQSAHDAPKAFHVSPFFDVDGQYNFSVTRNQGSFNLVIRNITDGDCVHTAVLQLEQQAATTPAFLRFLVTAPFSGIGVVLAIHFEALKLFIKGMKYRSKPPEPTPNYTPTTERAFKNEGRKGQPL